MFRISRKRKPARPKDDKDELVDSQVADLTKHTPILQAPPEPSKVNQTSDDDESESEADFMHFHSTEDDDSDNDNATALEKYKTPVATAPPSPKHPQLLVDMPAGKRWQTFMVRFIMSVLMIVGFILIILSGHLSVILMVIAVQILVFKECISVAHVPTKEKKLPWFRFINWYFLLTACYYLYGDLLLGHYHQGYDSSGSSGGGKGTADILNMFAQNHRFISFSLYLLGFIMFVLNLKRGHYKFQFLQFFWTHMTLLIVVFQSHFIICNILEGLVWFVVPVSLVICNDICAYLGGFFFGRMPLTKLSPKKTIEGFVIGGLGTVLLAFILAHYVVQMPYLLCPASRDLLSSSYWSFDNSTCSKAAMTTISAITKQHFYQLPVIGYQISWTSMHIHALVLATFASMIAPFGGFFASGFKRAFKLKDFGDSIPGHGGLTDRMDCQFMMGCFSYIYYTTFIKNAALSAAVASAIASGSSSDQIGVKELFAVITSVLDKQKQVELYRQLGDYLSSIN